MREFEYLFDKGLVKGLRKTTRARVRDQQIVEAYNVRMGTDGLEPYESIDMLPWWGGLSWEEELPPIAFAGSQHTLVVRSVEEEDKIQIVEIQEDTYPRVLIEFEESYGSEFFGIADFGLYTVLAGNKYMVDITWSNEDDSYTLNYHEGNDTMPLVNSCCNFRGQFIGGGVLSDWYGCGEKHVVYSDIGSINMVPDHKAEAGNTYIPTKFKILKVLPLEHHIVVYTSGDIWIMRPVYNTVAAFKLTRFLSIGIMNADAVAGDSNSHVLIDATGCMWEINNSLEKTNNLQKLKLGYQEFFENQDDTLRVLYDESDMSWRINTEEGAYLFRNGELTTCYQKLSAIVSNGDFHLAIGTENKDHCAKIITDRIDFNYNGIKTIQGIELSSGGGKETSVDIQFRFDMKEEFVSSGFTITNQYGQIAKPQAGIDFRIGVRFKYFSEMDLDWFKIRFKMSDLRGMRGVYAPPPRGQFV